MNGEEHEIVDPIDLCTPSGRLDRAAVGWSRTPLHRCNLRGPRLRTKRWNHWCVFDGRTALIVTLADLDYLGVATVLLRDALAGRDLFRRVLAVPGAMGFDLPDEVEGDVRFRAGGISIETLESDEATTLRVEARGLRRRLEAEVRVERAPGHESMNVVVPWSERRFQFTSKHVARRATGGVCVGATRTVFEVGHSFGCLDFGRGVWPYRTHWNWAAGACVQDGATIGINLGGVWTDGTGLTENALWIDGRVHKIAERVVFERDRVRPERAWIVRSEPFGVVDLRFEPSSRMDVGLPLAIVSSKLHMCFGKFSGTIVAGDGRAVEVRALDGWAEDHVARW